MARRSTTSDVNGRDHEELIAPVTILDARGRVVAVLPVAEFRRIHGMPARPGARDAFRGRRPPRPAMERAAQRGVRISEGRR